MLVNGAKLDGALLGIITDDDDVLVLNLSPSDASTRRRGRRFSMVIYDIYSKERGCVGLV